MDLLTLDAVVVPVDAIVAMAADVGNWLCKVLGICA